MPRKEEIAHRLQALKTELGTTQLIAVTKYSPLEEALMVYESGQFDLGENKVNDLKNRANIFLEKKLDQIRWHFIGHLQTNKVKELLKIPRLFAIHSVDSIRLLEELIKNKSHLVGTELKIFLQVNTSHEDEKSGFETKEELERAVEILVNNLSPFKFTGLMTMGTMRTEKFEEEAKRCFSELYDLKKYLEKKYKLNDLKLSMGMSQDYKIALLHGADYVRIGSTIFR